MIPCGLVLRSVGYRGTAMPGIPFDEGRATIRNDGGRVLDDAGVPIPGVYCTGWIKRGPSGVIGTNKKDATETVELLLEDLRAGIGARTGAHHTGRVEDLLARARHRRRPLRGLGGDRRRRMRGGRATRAPAHQARTAGTRCSTRPREALGPRSAPQRPVDVRAGVVEVPRRAHPAAAHGRPDPRPLEPQPRPRARRRTRSPSRPARARGPPGSGSPARGRARGSRSTPISSSSASAGAAPTQLCQAGEVSSRRASAASRSGPPKYVACTSSPANQPAAVGTTSASRSGATAM